MRRCRGAVTIRAGWSGDVDLERIASRYSTVRATRLGRSLDGTAPRRRGEEWCPAMFTDVKTRVKSLYDKIYCRVARLPSVDIDTVAPADVSAFGPIEDARNLPPRPDLGIFHDDLTPLIRIVKSVDPENVLELGTGRGNATANICAVCDAHVYTVSAPPGKMSGELISFVLPEEEIGRVYRAHGFAPRVTQILENTLTLELTAFVPEGTIDLAVIDACHDTDYVVNDFFIVLPTLRPDGIVLLHDTHPSRKLHLRGSYDACVRLRRMGYDIRHLRDTWWGIWSKGGFPPGRSGVTGRDG